jgi:hypothetical protein
MVDDTTRRLDTVNRDTEILRLNYESVLGRLQSARNRQESVMDEGKMEIIRWWGTTKKHAVARRLEYPTQPDSTLPDSPHPESPLPESPLPESPHPESPLPESSLPDAPLPDSPQNPKEKESGSPVSDTESRKTSPANPAHTLTHPQPQGQGSGGAGTSARHKDTNKGGDNTGSNDNATNSSSSSSSSSIDHSSSSSGTERSNSSADDDGTRTTGSTHNIATDTDVIVTRRLLTQMEYNAMTKNQRKKYFANAAKQQDKLLRPINRRTTRQGYIEEAKTVERGERVRLLYGNMIRYKETTTKARAVRNNRRQLAVLQHRANENDSPQSPYTSDDEIFEEALKNVKAKEMEWRNRSYEERISEEVSIDFRQQRAEHQRGQHDGAAYRGQ